MKSLFLLTVLVLMSPMFSLAQEVPLVYDVEHAGMNFPPANLPEFEQLPIVRPLPDPFEWSDKSGRSTEFKDWSRRGSEIKAEIERYGIGKKPPRPEDITASFAAGTLTVKVTETVNGKNETLLLTAKVQLPDGDGPFPAVIGVGRGSLPAEI